MRAWKTPAGETLIELDGLFYLSDGSGLMRKVYGPADVYSIDGANLLEDGRPVIVDLSEIPEAGLPSMEKLRKSLDTEFIQEELDRDAKRLRSPTQLPELDGGALDILLVPHNLLLYVLAEGKVIWEESSIGCGPTAAPRIERVVRRKYGNQIRSYRSHLTYE